MNQSCPICGSIYPDTFAFCKKDGSALTPLPAAIASEPLDASPTPHESAAPVPPYSLFGIASVSLAAAFGGPLPSFGLMALNYHRLGRPRAAAIMLAIGVALQALPLLLYFLIPSEWLGVMGASLFGGAIAAFRGFQAGEKSDHVLRGGNVVTPWAGLGVGVAFLAVLFIGGAAFGLLRAFSTNQHSTQAYRASAQNPASAQTGKILIGSKDEIYLSGSATESEARALGEALKSIGYFQDRGVTVVLSNDSDGRAVSFVVRDGIWNQPEMVSNFDEIGREIAPSIGGFPLKVRLVNSLREIKSESTVGKQFIGAKDHVYYLGSASEADASALGKTLKEIGYLNDKGVTVMLSKHTDATAISFVVQEGLGRNPKNIASFQQIVRRVAPSVGGLPIEMRLLDSRLAPEADTIIK